MRYVPLTSVIKPIMLDLTRQDLEIALLWLQSSTLTTEKPMCESVTTRELYQRYQLWCLGNDEKPVTVNDLWALIQLLHPKITIVGRPGDRVFYGLKLKIVFPLER